MNIRPRWLLSLTAVLAMLAPGAALASPDTFRRGFANILQGPLDVALSPATAGAAVARNWSEVGDNAVESSFYPLLGHMGLTLLHIGAGSFRVVTGLIELVPGLFLFPFPGADLPADFNPFAQGDAFVEAKNPLGEKPPWLKYVLPVTPFTIDVKFGVVPSFSVYDEPAE